MDQAVPIPGLRLPHQGQNLTWQEIPEVPNNKIQIQTNSNLNHYSSSHNTWIFPLNSKQDFSFPFLFFTPVCNSGGRTRTHSILPIPCSKLHIEPWASKPWESRADSVNAHSNQLQVLYAENGEKDGVFTKKVRISNPTQHVTFHFHNVSLWKILSKCDKGSLENLLYASLFKGTSPTPNWLYLQDYLGLDCPSNST